MSICLTKRSWCLQLITSQPRQSLPLIALCIESPPPLHVQNRETLPWKAPWSPRGLVSITLWRDPANPLFWHQRNVNSEHFYTYGFNPFTHTHRKQGPWETNTSCHVFTDASFCPTPSVFNGGQILKQEGKYLMVEFSSRYPCILNTPCHSFYHHHLITWELVDPTCVPGQNYRAKSMKSEGFK